VQQPSVLAAVPAVKLIITQQDLQALVRELQQQPQVCLHKQEVVKCMVYTASRHLQTYSDISWHRRAASPSACWWVWCHMHPLPQ
jgi:hypothetical protein